MNWQDPLSSGGSCSLRNKRTAVLCTSFVLNVSCNRSHTAKRKHAWAHSGQRCDDVPCQLRQTALACCSRVGGEGGDGGSGAGRLQTGVQILTSQPQQPEEEAQESEASGRHRENQGEMQIREGVHS